MLVRHQFAGPPVGRWVRSGAGRVQAGVLWVAAMVAALVAGVEGATTDRASARRHLAGYGMISVAVAGLVGVWWALLVGGLLLLLFDHQLGE